MKRQTLVNVEYYDYYYNSSLTIGYLECIFVCKNINHNIYISFPFQMKSPSHHWLATLVYLCAWLFGAPSVLLGPVHSVRRLARSKLRLVPLRSARGSLEPLSSA